MKACCVHRIYKNYRGGGAGRGQNLKFEVVYSFWKMKERVLSGKKDREYLLSCKLRALLNLEEMEMKTYTNYKISQSRS